jgi:glycosyltransferase involved in cell wall biosynthesis
VITPSPVSPRPKLIHLTTTDISLDWLLGPQLEAFAEAGYEVWGASAPGPHVAALEARGIGHLPLHHATRSVDLFSDLRAVRELIGVLRTARPDIVHTHNPKPGVYGRMVGRAIRVPVVINTQHGIYALPTDPWPRRAVVHALERVAAACSDAELVQARDDIDTLRRLRVPEDRLVELGNGIDLVRFDPERVERDGGGAVRRRLRAELGVNDDTVVVGAVGRLVAEKGYRELFAAASHLRRSAPQVRLVVIGPDDPAKADAVTVDEIAAATQRGVTFLGSRSNVDEWYRAMDMYVLASYREGFPRSAMEAAAMGLPVVATDIRGCRQVVDDGVTGVLVPPHDGVALAEAIGWLATDGDRRRTMGTAGTRRAELEFDQERVIGRTLEVYRRLLARSATSA